MDRVPRSAAKWCSRSWSGNARSARGTPVTSCILLPQGQQDALEDRRREQLADQWQQRHNIRAGVKGTIPQAIRRTRIRRTRCTGLPKTHLGHLSAATAINIIRLDAWLNETPLGGTHTSPDSNPPPDDTITPAGLRISQRSHTRPRFLARSR
jgi:hypothetical protein